MCLRSEHWESALGCSQEGDHGEKVIPTDPQPRAGGPLHAIEKDGGFRKGDQRGVDFATGRLALGALRAGMIYDAWLASADAPVGYPTGNVRAIENGTVRATGVDGSGTKAA